MPFNDRLLTIVATAPSLYIEPHMATVEMITRQLTELPQVELAMVVPNTSIMGRDYIRKKYQEGQVQTLIESKAALTQFQAQRSLLVNARTPYTLFLDLRVSLQEGALERLVSFILDKNPIKISGKLIQSQLDPYLCLWCTHLARSVMPLYSVTITVPASMTEYLAPHLITEQITALTQEVGDYFETPVDRKKRVTNEFE